MSKPPLAAAEASPAGPATVTCVTATGKVKCTKEQTSEHWEAVPASKNGRFFDCLANLAGVEFPKSQDLPFRRSIALIAGVAKYKNVKDFEALSFVANDVRDLRDFLLGPGCFDEVYVMQDEHVTSENLNVFMLNRAETLMDSSDRFLFYFSGHGLDGPRQKTGYLAFGDAAKHDYAHEVVPVKKIYEWSDSIPAKHALFILDACSAGLGLTSKGLPDVRILNASSLTGSRAVITAGTSSEKTYGFQTPDGRGGSVFARAFLNALGGRWYDGPLKHVMTAGVVFGKAKDLAKDAAVAANRNLTPRMDPFDEMDFPGDFLFVNPSSEGTPVARDLTLLLKASEPDQVSASLPSAATTADLSVGIDGHKRHGSALYVLDLGRIADRPVSTTIDIENLARGQRDLAIRVDRDGVDASFVGGSWSATLPSKGQVQAILKIPSPKRSQVRVGFADLWLPAEVRFLSRDQEVFRVRVIFSVAAGETTVERDSGSKRSGTGKSFSEKYKICATPPGPDYVLIPGREKFWLTGDRLCNAWSTCELERPGDGSACLLFSLQGHDELADGGIRESTGHIRATFALREPTPRLMVGNTTPAEP